MRAGPCWLLSELCSAMRVSLVALHDPTWKTYIKFYSGRTAGCAGPGVSRCHPLCCRREQRLCWLTSMSRGSCAVRMCCAGAQDINEEEGVRAVHEAFKLGINYFDTSPFYGGTRSETACAHLVVTALCPPPPPPVLPFRSPHH